MTGMFDAKDSHASIVKRQARGSGQTVLVHVSSTLHMDTNSDRRAAHERCLNRNDRFMAEALGISDGDLLAELRIAGYTRQTIALIEFAPLVRVAWADGHVSQRQRSAIAQVALRKHLCNDTPAAKRLADWLERCPSDAVFDVSLSTIRAKWNGLPLDACEVLQRQFIRDCTAVARAADAAVTDNKIAPEEGRVLARILVSLKPSLQSE